MKALMIQKVQNGENFITVEEEYKGIRKKAPVKPFNLNARISKRQRSIQVTAVEAPVEDFTKVVKNDIRRVNSASNIDRLAKQKKPVKKSRSFDLVRSTKMSLFPESHMEECFNLTFEIVRLMKKLKGFSQKKLVIDNFQNVTNKFRSENRTLMMKIDQRRKSCEGVESGGPVFKDRLLIGKRDYSGFVSNQALLAVEKFARTAPEPPGDLVNQVRRGIHQYRFSKAANEFKKNSLRKLTMRVNASRAKEKSQLISDGTKKMTSGSNISGHMNNLGVGGIPKQKAVMHSRSTTPMPNLAQSFSKEFDKNKNFLKKGTDLHLYKSDQENVDRKTKLKPKLTQLSIRTGSQEGESLSKLVKNTG
jgi:hypothetical protein